jgi:hypothetical protein
MKPGGGFGGSLGLYWEEKQGQTDRDGMSLEELEFSNPYATKPVKAHT